MVKSKRPARPALTRQVILEAAVKFVDENGVEKLTLRSLGAAIDRDPTAFYRHYRNKEELLVAVADTLLDEILAGFEPSDDWAETLREIARRARAVYLTHPQLGFTLGSSPDALLSNARVNEQVMNTLERSGLTDADIPRYADMIARWVIALNMQDSATASDPSLDSAARAGARRVFAALPPDQFPLTVRFAAQLLPDLDESFSFGFEVILASIAARASKTPTPAAPAQV